MRYNLKDKPQLKECLEKYGLLPEKYSDLNQMEFDALIAKVDAFIEKKKKEPLDILSRGHPQLFQGMTQMLIIGLSSLVSELVDSGIGFIPTKSEKEKEHATQFSFELLLNLAIGSKILKTLCTTLSKTCNTSEEYRTFIAEALHVVALMTLLTAASKGNEEKLITYLNTVKEALLESLDQLQAILPANQARLSLLKEDYKGFIESYHRTLELAQISHTQLLTEIKKNEKFTKLLMSTGSEEITTTLSQAL